MKVRAVLRQVTVFTRRCLGNERAAVWRHRGCAEKTPPPLLPRSAYSVARRLAVGYLATLRCVIQQSVDMSQYHSLIHSFLPFFLPSFLHSFIQSSMALQPFVGPWPLINIRHMNQKFHILWFQGFVTALCECIDSWLSNPSIHKNCNVAA
jgi:hypothetical protein